MKRDVKAIDLDCPTCGADSGSKCRDLRDMLERPKHVRGFARSQDVVHASRALAARKLKEG